MKKKHKLIIIPIIVIISILILIGISKAVTKRTFTTASLLKRESSAGKDESIFCLAKGLMLDSEQKQQCVVNIGGYPDNVIKPESGKVIKNEVKGTIKGTTAYKYTESDTNTRTTVTDKGNAKLAYIFYAARGEVISDHNNSKGQWGVWGYFHTWMKFCGKTLGVSEIFNYNSLDVYEENASLIEKAEKYYQTLVGEKTVDIISKKSGVHNSKDGSKKYIGPFKVQYSNEFITSIDEINGVSGYQGIATKVDGNLVDEPTTSTFTNDFYIVINADSDPNQTFTLGYRVLKVKALMKLYSQYNSSKSNDQPIAVVNTSEGRASLTTKFKVTNTEEDISLQKYIFQTFDKFEKNGNALKVTNSTFVNEDDRGNRYATESSKSGEEGIYKYINMSSPLKASEDSTSYKKNNPVNIKAGEYVAYKITVYNNAGTISDDYIEVLDRINEKGVLKRSIYKL